MSAAVQKEYEDIDNIEPKVVVLNDTPVGLQISVRMPLARLIQTHDTDYLEIRYMRSKDGSICHYTNLSPRAAASIHNSHEQLATLPPVAGYVHPWTLGKIDQLFTAINKLKDFDDQRLYQKYFDKA